jgi:hypothetical protein
MLNRHAAPQREQAGRDPVSGRDGVEDVHEVRDGWGSLRREWAAEHGLQVLVIENTVR